jgi:hypothetical protein
MQSILRSLLFKRECFLVCRKIPNSFGNSVSTNLVSIHFTNSGRLGFFAVCKTTFLKTIIIILWPIYSLIEDSEDVNAIDVSRRTPRRPEATLRASSASVSGSTRWCYTSGTPSTGLCELKSGSYGPYGCRWPSCRVPPRHAQTTDGQFAASSKSR